MRRAALILTAGSAIALALVMAATQLISNLTYDRSHRALRGNRSLASYIPARRAANVDPAQVLGTE